jgi:hypothetical protein
MSIISAKSDIVILIETVSFIAANFWPYCK